MALFQPSSFHEAYRSLLTTLIKHGHTEVNARTQAKILYIPGGVSFKLHLGPGRLPVAGNRRYYPHVAAAEAAWQFMGTKDPEFILKKAPKLWSKFLEDEEVTEDRGNGPVTFNKKVLKTAYGYRWRQAFGRDQLWLAIEELERNPTNRQLFVQAWDPRTDGLGGSQPKNIPCPIGFAISRGGDNLHMNVFIRSSDVFVGLPYDVMVYALTLDAIAAQIGCRPGSMHVTLAHAHLYETHWNAAKACTEGLSDRNHMKREERELLSAASTTWASHCEPNLPCWSVEMILRDPDSYVAHMKTLAGRVQNNSWDPQPEVVE